MKRTLIPLGSKYFENMASVIEDFDRPASPFRALIRKLAACAPIVFALLLSTQAATAGCHLWSFSDATIDQDMDISGKPTNGRALVRFYLVCNASITNVPRINPFDGTTATPLSEHVPLMVAAHPGSGNLLTYRTELDISPLENTYLMIYPQGVCDATGLVTAERQTQTYNILPTGAWPNNIVTSCTEDLNQTVAPIERPDNPNPALTARAMQDPFKWRSVKSTFGDSANPLSPSGVLPRPEPRVALAWTTTSFPPFPPAYAKASTRDTRKATSLCIAMCGPSPASWPR
jgi:hypothetical protein